MARWNVKVMVEYDYVVEADGEDEADQLGWEYEDYPFSASVYSIDVEECEVG